MRDMPTDDNKDDVVEDFYYASKQDFLLILMHCVLAYLCINPRLFLIFTLKPSFMI
jgi:hypothetical protein